MNCSNEMNELYVEASKISCNNMLNLAKKHQDFNKLQYDLKFDNDACEKYNTQITGDYIKSQWINNKHCDYERDKYNMNWWDNQHSYSLLKSCIPEELLINTKNKSSKTPTKISYNCVSSTEESLGKFARFEPNCNNGMSVLDRYNNHIL